MRGPSDRELLHLIQAVETQEDAVDEALAATPEPDGDPCPSCGEPAETLGDCTTCAEPGCLPRELWTPGMPDNCLTLCVRCARAIHVACAVEDEAGNPRCATCRW